MSQTTLIGTRLSQELLRQTAERHQQIAADVGERWIEHNTRVMQIIASLAQGGLSPCRKSPGGFPRSQEWSITCTLCVRWSWSRTSTTAPGAGG
jgi:hypothetical protein